MNLVVECKTHHCMVDGDLLWNAKSPTGWEIDTSELSCQGESCNWVGHITDSDGHWLADVDL